MSGGREYRMVALITGSCISLHDARSLVHTFPFTYTISTSSELDSQRRSEAKNATGLENNSEPLFFSFPRHLVLSTHFLALIVVLVQEEDRVPSADITSPSFRLYSTVFLFATPRLATLFTITPPPVYELNRVPFYPLLNSIQFTWRAPSITLNTLHSTLSPPSY